VIVLLLLPLLGVVLITASGILVAWKPEAVLRFWRGPPISRARGRFARVRGLLVEGVGTGWTYLLIISASIPPIVTICVTVGLLFSHPPFWSHNVSLLDWFMREGATAPTLLKVLRGVSWIAKWRPVAVISAVAGLALFLVAKQRRWLGPVMIATALVVEREVQLAIGFFVHQQHPPTTLASFPSGGVARVVAIYGFIVYLFLRLRSRPAWRTTVVAWTLVALFGFLEGYARAALLLHWPFDIPGGWLLGILLLTTMVAAASVFDGLYFPSRGASLGDLDSLERRLDS
jgi:membrane-associated phospholipid phosphatase